MLEAESAEGGVVVGVSVDWRASWAFAAENTAIRQASRIRRRAELKRVAKLNSIKVLGVILKR